MLFAGLERWLVVVGAEKDPEAVEVGSELVEVVAGVADEAGQGRVEFGGAREPGAEELDGHVPGVAMVALVQVSQFVVTIALLLLLTMTSSASAASLVTPSPTTVVVIAAIAAFLSVSLLVPVVRDWLASRAMPTVRQMWPRLIEIIEHPGKVAVAIGGNVLLTMGYILAFDASLAAFGQKLGLVQVALVYLAGNAAGAAIPTPGGIGTIEVAFIGGLTAAGLNPGVAASVTIVFRVVTFWLPIPIGWGAMRYLQRTGEL